SLLDPGSSVALRIRTRLAGESDYLRGGHEAILAALQEARSAGDAELLAEALSMAHHCLLGPDHARHRRELAVELIKTSFRTERRSDLLMGLLWQTVDSYSEGDRMPDGTWASCGTSSASKTTWPSRSWSAPST
ncbi:MAG: hypothetical protein ACRDOA_23935, partial [Streptosporangiaceae bacterium]